MNPAARGSQLLRHRTRERDHVVVRLAEELAHALGLNRRDTQLGHVLLGDHTELGPRLAHRQLDLQPQLQAVLVRPDATHCFPRVSRDHRPAPTLADASTPMSDLYCLPSKRTPAAAR